MDQWIEHMYRKHGSGVKLTVTKISAEDWQMGSTLLGSANKIIYILYISVFKNVTNFISVILNKANDMLMKYLRIRILKPFNFLKNEGRIRLD